MEFEIEKTCCFTGHKPEKIIGSEKDIRANLNNEIENAVKDGISIFISGMARGVDTWAALEVIAVKAKNPAVRLICAVPFEGVEKNRTDEEKAVFRSIINSADSVEYISKKHFRSAFVMRDRWMVDHAKRVIAVFNGTHGGTEYTIRYANEKGRDVRIIEDKPRQ